MKNQEILNSALKIIAQTPLTGDAEDYAERAPYLIASFCAEALELNNHLLAASGKTPLSGSDMVYLPLESAFPLVDRLAPLACFYLAAMLVLDEDDELFDKLYAVFCDKLAAAWKEIPSLVESIKEKYFHK